MNMESLSDTIEKMLEERTRDLPIVHFNVWINREGEYLGVYCVFYGLEEFTLKKAKKEYKQFIEGRKRIFKSYLDALSRFIEKNLLKL